MPPSFTASTVVAATIKLLAQAIWEAAEEVYDQACEVVCYTWLLGHQALRL